MSPAAEGSAAARRPGRLVWRVLPPVGRARYGWRVVDPGGSEFRHNRKDQAVADATRAARRVWERDQVHTQVVIHKANGQFQEERTYGDDPPEREG